MSSSSSSNIPHEPQCGNPYNILSLDASSATPAKIKKAFRDLSLKLHPDKRPQNLSQSQIDDLDKQFHNIKEARSFLLDSQYANEKGKYDAALASKSKRMEEDRRRDLAMNDKRRKMKEDFMRKMKVAFMEQKGQQQHNDVVGESSSSATASDRIHNLRQAGKRMREMHGKKTQSEAKRHAAKTLKKNREELESRQVRFKWRRNSNKITGVGTYYSAYDLKMLLSKIGEVENVELIGSKGNAALVTFKNVSSPEDCVKLYQNDENMRANYVGKRKEEYSRNDNVNQSDILNMGGVSRESLCERNLRQAAERELALRQIEMEDCDEHQGVFKNDEYISEPYDLKQGTTLKSMPQCRQSYPPNFTSSAFYEERFQQLSSFETLEELEKKILNSIHPGTA
mmetsp:Transcript_21153/g.29624  ORF Transcript_21153/g.29624 Transcript_21153/m.29624 type:complete len:397 (-) Transcript_21153:394-1584(-)|eukprot:CAMPEP_0184869566 /NCGR_PEP_ID=MMETSP0580-20130426/34565_1 /TAXON_ID=1118495 /ORGANISM="Dactyliosolen fragilissimus" /LENGTH=396 /DNA_ID=CAMNT_0027371133 /DNA_START=52 /DNA_END=1242 /DNA_ORIENTATION=+